MRWIFVAIISLIAFFVYTISILVEDYRHAEERDKPLAAMVIILLSLIIATALFGLWIEVRIELDHYRK